MLKHIIKISSILLVILSLQSCKNSITEPSQNMGSLNSYTPLIVGTTRQYYNSTGFQMATKIVGTAFRDDGQKVFIEQYRYRSEANYYYGYVYIRNGYYYSTSLYKTGNADNPYGENRFAKLNYKDGESWYVNPYSADSDKILATSHLVDEVTTNAGTFKDVYKVHFVYNSNRDTSDVYYAKGVGPIVIGFNYNKYYLGYLKLDGKEYGKEITE